MEQTDNIAVSVIIPIFNAERHLEECLDSCLEQTLKNTELICVNDGSTDNTSEILERYAREYSNICILEQENQGAGIARNLGIKHAMGEFITFMDSDDYYPDQEALQKLYTAAIRENLLVCGGSAVFLKDGEIDRKQLDFCFKNNGKLNYRNYQKEAGFTCYIYNRKFMESHGLLFPKYRYFEDPPFFVRTMAAVEVFYAISDCVYVIRNTDKIIRYDRKDIIINTLDGIRDVLIISKEKDFLKLGVNMCDALKRYLPYIYKAIYRGNADVRERYEKVSSIYEGWMSEDADGLGEIEGPKLLSNAEIDNMMGASLKKEKEFMDQIRTFEQILIYGAGRVGHWLYDYIIKRGYAGEIEFMVSSAEPKYTACGKNVRSILDCEKYKDSALVLIANKNSADQMEENAYKHHFMNVKKVPYFELVLWGADMEEDSYTTIF